MAVLICGVAKIRQGEFDKRFRVAARLQNLIVHEQFDVVKPLSSDQSRERSTIQPFADKLVQLALLLRA